MTGFTRTKRQLNRAHALYAYKKKVTTAIMKMGGADQDVRDFKKNRRREKKMEKP